MTDLAGMAFDDLPGRTFEPPLDQHIKFVQRGTQFVGQLRQDFPFLRRHAIPRTHLFPKGRGCLRVQGRRRLAGVLRHPCLAHLLERFLRGFPRLQKRPEPLHDFQFPRAFIRGFHGAMSDFFQILRGTAKNLTVILR